MQLDYKTLYQNVAANLASNQHFTIQVCTTHTERGVETEWEVYVAQRHAGGLFAEGATAQEAYNEFLRLINPAEQEALDKTSADVGTAEIDA